MFFKFKIKNTDTRLIQLVKSDVYLELWMAGDILLQMSETKCWKK